SAPERRSSRPRGTGVEMPPRRRPLSTTLAALLSTAAATASPSQVSSQPGPNGLRLQRLDGAIIEGESVRLDRTAGSFAVRRDGGRDETVPVQETVSVLFTARAQRAKPVARPSAPTAILIEFSNGDVLSGVPAGGNADTLRVSTSLLGDKAF